MTDVHGSAGTGAVRLAAALIVVLSACTTPTAQPPPAESLFSSADPSSVPTASSAPSAATTEAPHEGVWEASTIQPFSEEDRVRITYRGLLWFDGLGWVAYGIDRDGFAGIWVSADGMEWTRASSPAPPANQGYDIVDIARSDADDGRFVAIGHNMVLSSDGYWEWGTASVVLISDDGREWSLVPSVPATATWLNAVAWGADGFVAVGTETSFPREDGQLVDGRVWSSVDGIDWSESAPPELVDALPLGVETLANSIIAFGFPLSREGGTPMVSWTSLDRTTWTRSELRAGTRGTGGIQAYGRAEGAELLVAGNLDGPFVASSTDGVSWSADELSPEGAFPGGLDVRQGAAVIVAVVAAPDGVVESPMWVRDEVDGPWREVDWLSQMPESVVVTGANLAAIQPAIGAERTAILLGDGMVIVSPDPLP